MARSTTVRKPTVSARNKQSRSSQSPQADPKNFTAALPKVQRKGRIFVDYLPNQRGATVVMPYGVHARADAPVAAPITWKEMETIDTPSHFHIGDAKELIKRAGSKALAGWGRVDQQLPDL
jgi:bifunctional non-homologous end joining protein LigD